MLTVSLMTLWLASAAVADDAGQKVFIDYGCNECHSIKAAKIEATETDEEKRGPDLSEVGKEHDAAWIGKFLNKEVELDGKKHKKRWRGEDEELKNLTDWLVGLSKAE